MPIDDFVTRGINPFTKAPLEYLDLERLARIRDDPAAIHLKSKMPTRADGTTTGSRLGGQPLLPPKTAWPKGPKRPLTFVGQLDFEQLAASHKGALPLPRAGVLGFFYDVEKQPWGLQREDSRSWKLVYVPDVAAAKPTAPKRGEALPLRPLEPHFVKAGGKSKATYHRVCGAPVWHQSEPRLGVQLLLNDLESSDVGALRAAERRGIDVVGIARAAREWRLLWQIDWEPDLFDWGDCGSLYLLIRQKDLEALRFDEAWCVLQCL